MHICNYTFYCVIEKNYIYIFFFTSFPLDRGALLLASGAIFRLQACLNGNSTGHVACRPSPHKHLHVVSRVLASLLKCY